MVEKAANLAVGSMLEGLSNGATQGAERTTGAWERTLASAERALVEPQSTSKNVINAFVEGNDGRLHETLVALEKADISLKFAVSVRNRLLEAYREVMRMEM